MARSPIEIMIDRACGIPDGPARHPVERVTLFCPSCKSWKLVEKHESDPEGTSEVHVLCPDCHDGEFDDPRYFNSHGDELFWTRLTNPI